MSAVALNGTKRVVHRIVSSRFVDEPVLSVVGG